MNTILLRKAIDALQQKIYYIVCVPEIPDSYNHILSPQEIESMSEQFILDPQFNLEHDIPTGLSLVFDNPDVASDITLCESYIAPMDITSFHGNDISDSPILQGSWIICVKMSDKLWPIMSQVESGVSFEGYGRLEDMPMET